MKGDFHAHSTCSDGVLPPEGVIEEAERESLDFFAITDHNTWAYPSFEDSDEVLVIAGVEVTMPYGHFNVFSTTTDAPAWMSRLPDPVPVDHESDQSRESAALVEEIARSELRASINHPLLFPWEWTDGDVSLDGFDYLEVWNDPTWPENRLANPAALEMWTRWLNAGLRATAIGGSDFHNPEKFYRGDGQIVDGHRVGIPRTFVLASERSPEAILEALDRRRAYVTMGPTLDVAFETDSGTVDIGTDLGDGDTPVTVWASARGEGELEVRLVRDGEIVARSTGPGPGLEHRLEPTPGSSGWARVDVADPAGEIIAFTNPVFWGPRPQPEALSYQNFADPSLPSEINRRWQDLSPADQGEKP